MMWTIQTERFRLRGSELASRSLFRGPMSQDDEELLELDLEEIPEPARASMRRLYETINDICSEYEALVEMFRSATRRYQPDSKSRWGGSRGPTERF